MLKITLLLTLVEILFISYKYWRKSTPLKSYLLTYLSAKISFNFYLLYTNFVPKSYSSSFWIFLNLHFNNERKRLNHVLTDTKTNLLTAKK